MPDVETGSLSGHLEAADDQVPYTSADDLVGSTGPAGDVRFRARRQRKHRGMPCWSTGVAGCPASVHGVVCRRSRPSGLRCGEVLGRLQHEFHPCPGQGGCMTWRACCRAAVYRCRRRIRRPGGWPARGAARAGSRSGHGREQMRCQRWPRSRTPSASPEPRGRFGRCRAGLGPRGSCQRHPGADDPSGGAAGGGAGSLETSAGGGPPAVLA